MKKLALFIVIIALLLSVVSCGAVRNASALSSFDNKSSSGILPMDNGISKEGTQSQKSDVRNLMSPAPVAFYTYEAYLDGIEELDLPEDFVHSDSLSHLGTFRQLTFLSDTWNGNYDSYEYVLQTEDESYVTLSFDHKPGNTLLGCRWVRGIDKTDLRDLSDVEFSSLSGYADLRYLYCLGDLRYLYDEDMNLTTITRLQNGIEIAIRGWGQTISKYPQSDTTPIGKLLNKDLALAAYEEYILPITETNPPDPPQSTETTEPSDSEQDDDSPEKPFVIAAVSAVLGAAAAKVTSVCIAVGKKPAEKTDEQNTL